MIHTFKKWHFGFVVCFFLGKEETAATMFLNDNRGEKKKKTTPKT